MAGLIDQRDTHHNTYAVPLAVGKQVLCVLDGQKQQFTEIDGVFARRHAYIDFLPLQEAHRRYRCCLYFLPRQQCRRSTL